ncbi:MAG: inverse autotransporter beta domain-containing protein [Chlamydiia bacterium]|nr:inverse autotransporter beta domain-containing protein [Chlamydiia bacterium]
MKWLLFLIPILGWSLEDTPSFSRFKHREYKGVGYDKGYTSIDVHLTFAEFPGFVTFFNPCGHVFNDGRLAFNIGLGGRVIAANEKWMGGINVYYDYRSSSTLSPQQLGGGAELFISDYALRFNGYAPIGTVKQTEGSRAAAALANLQGEVEKELLKGDHYVFWGAIGAYYLTGRAYQNHDFGKAWGSDIRLTALLWKWVEILFETTYDRIYHFTFQGMLALKIPFGGKPTKTQAPFDLYQPVKRREIIPLEKKHL